MNGFTATVFGPNGARYPRSQILASLNSQSRELLGAAHLGMPHTDMTSATVTALATGGMQTGVATLADLDGAGHALDDQNRVVGKRGTMSEVSAERGTGNMPTVFFGTTRYEGWTTEAADVGATSIKTSFQVTPGSTVVIGSGNRKETVTVTSLSTRGAAPLPFRAVVVLPGNRRYRGDALDTQITRQSAAWPVFSPLKDGARSDPRRRVGRVSPSAFGQGTTIYDTTLNKLIWSKGTAWADATGAVV